MKYRKISGLVGYLAWLGGCSAQQQPETPPPQVEPPCDEPLQTFGDIVVAQGEMRTVEVKVCEDSRYTVCTHNPIGQPNIYGKADAHPTITTFDAKSDDSTTVDDGTGNMVPRRDCFSFETQDAGVYYVGVHGTVDSETNLWVSASKQSNIPSGFEKALLWPTPTCTELTTPEYGPYNAAWGNAADLNRPFFDGSPDYIHGGGDIACTADMEVLSPCDGTITDSNDAGGTWGWHTVVDCDERQGNVLSFVIIHVNQSSVLPIGTRVTAGQVVGTVFPLVEPGEVEHVHLTVSRKSHNASEAARFHPERGACRQSEWTEAQEFWFNPLDADLYQNPPASLSK